MHRGDCASTFYCVCLSFSEFLCCGMLLTTILTIATPACPLPSSKHQAPGVVKGQVYVGLACNMVIFGM